MSKLTQILADARSQATEQGGGLSDRAVTALKAYRKQAAIASWAILMAALAAFVFVLVASAIYLRDPSQLKLVVGGLGLSLGGALVALRSTWRDWSQANLLMVMIEDASDAQIQTLIDTLIKKL